MKAYKLFRKMKDGSIAPLFINKTQRLELDTWYKSECHPTKAYDLLTDYLSDNYGGY